MPYVAGISGPGDNSYYTEWYYGCGPTAGGNVLDYWQNETGGYTLLNGSVDNTIATVGHIEEYYEATANTANRGGGGSGVASDPHNASDGHNNNTAFKDSLADYMYTSRWDQKGLRTGWSGYGGVGEGMREYVANETAHTAAVFNLEAPGYGDGLATIANLRKEIDANRPVIMLVDTDADGTTDHFVPVYGYDLAGAGSYYYYSLWDAATGLEMQNFASMTNGEDWGIFGMTVFDVSGADYTDRGSATAWFGGDPGPTPTAGGGPGPSGGTPEPGTSVLILLGLAAVAGSARRGKRPRRRAA